jgi:hypothetical protein
MRHCVVHGFYRCCYLLVETCSFLYKDTNIFNSLINWDSTILKHQFWRSSCVIFLQITPSIFWNSLQDTFTSYRSHLIQFVYPLPVLSEYVPRTACERLSHPHNDTNPRTPCFQFIATTGMASGPVPNAPRQEFNNPCTPLRRRRGKRFQ